ncbi:MAG: DoxX family protein [Candidatus Pacebacteria bacterium]|nr:DoxX family protein [Candidatus Paceibacterota bacterium]
MTMLQKYSLVALRVTLGWYFLYAGFTKIIDSSWSAAGYLNSAKTFPGFFAWLASPENIGWVSTLNEWALFLVGAALVLGIFVRFASWGGIVLMTLYWLPVLDFPHVGHGFIIDDHIIFIAVFVVLAAFNPKNSPRLCRGVSTSERMKT